MTDESDKKTDKEEPLDYVPKEDSVLKEIALGIVEGKIFCDRQVENKDLLPHVFMILALMDDKTADQLKHQNICMIYEYMDKAGPGAVNGFPCFMSMRTLNKEDTEKVMKYYEEALALRNKFLNN